MTTKNELVSKFGPDSDKAETITSLETLMKIYALSAEDLYIRWEQFSYHKNENKTELNDRNIEQFKHFMQQQIEKKLNNATGSVSSNPSSIKKPKTLRPNGSSPSLFGFGVPKTPTLKKRKLDNTPSRWDANGGSSLKVEFIGSETGSPGEAVHFKTPSASKANSTPMMAPVTPSPLKNNPEPGKVLDSLNPESLEISEGIDFESEKKIRVTPFYDPKKYKFRTMRQSLLDASDVLDEQIDIFTQIVQDHYKLSANDFGDPTIQSQSEIITVGRIVSDSPTSEGILNIDSLALETSRSAGIGRRVRLNLEKIKEASFFPGQLVSFRGKNANGEYFMVEEILQLPYLNSPVSTSTELHDYQQVLNHKSMKVVVTSGPYTATNNFDFSNLSAFVERLNTEIKPHSVIMFGPFIDITHPMVASGTLPEFPNLKIQPRTLDEVFTKVMAPILKNIDSRIQVILIPSTKDALSKHAAYPQDSLDRKLLQLPKNFKCFTNPSTFQLNEIFFGCSNVDIFKDLKEVTKGGNTTLRNRFDRVSEHVLQQRRFYPVFPGGIKKRKVKNSEGHDVFEHISGADLEVPYLGLTEFVGNFIPDIIIIPSELYHFARVVQNVVMINPGMFVRPNGGRGTFAQFSIESPDLTNGKLTKIDGDDDVYLHNVWKRSRIDIVTS